MAKVDREYQSRMEGMLYALKIAKEEGIDALEKEIRMRGILKLDIWSPKDYIETIQIRVSENVYCSMLATMLFTIHDLFGFGKKRLNQLKEGFNKNTQAIGSLDYYGEHYVRFEDYAVYLNERYDMKLDADRMAALQDLADERDNRIGKCDIKAVIKAIREAGFEDAAAWLERKVS